jgi:hypothetical protein
VEFQAERALEMVGVGAKRQAGTVDPGTEAVQTAVVLGEGKAVASDRLRAERVAARLKGCEPAVLKRRLGSSEAKRPALPVAVFSAAATQSQGSKVTRD